MSVILGTAGHIDHGKTSLIQALTRIDCDRLQEEKKRGITIDLGFAWLDLPDGDKLGIIDVPGHERFVRTMVAGACGIDFVLLVIAADEGIMPQTREHIDICQLLGITHGIVAITKKDLVDAEWLAMVTEDIRAGLAGTFLENAPCFAVSSETKEGLDELTACIVREAQRITKNKASDLFRLPIDRVFTIRGHGTVVTGTVLSGHLTTGEEIVLMPGGRLSHARAIERHEQQVTEISYGSRCAINVQGLETGDIERGELITKPGSLFPSTRFYAALRVLPSAPRPLPQRTEVHFHHTTKESLVKLVFRDRTAAKPGETVFAEILFPGPVCGVFGDYAVIRSSSPLRTIAGAQILCPIPPLWPKRHTHSEADRQKMLERWMALPKLAPKNKELFVREVLDLLGAKGAGFRNLRVATALTTKQLEKTLTSLCDAGQVVWWQEDSAGGRDDFSDRSFLGASYFAALLDGCLARAADIHAKNPLKAAFAREELQGAWCADLPKKLVQKVVDHLVGTGKLAAEGNGLKRADHSIRLANKEEKLRKQLLAAHTANPLAPPRYKDVLTDLGVTEKEAAPVLAMLLKQGDLVRIADGQYYEKNAFADILSRVKDWYAGHDTLDITDLRTLLGVSRKYLIALLEYMDNSHITVRVGDVRKLRQT